MAVSPSATASGQGSQLAFVPEATTPAKLAGTLVAFANARGGTVLVGVDTSSGRPMGIADPEATLDLALKAALSTDPPLILPLPKVTEIDGQATLVITVPRGLPHVYALKGRYLVRDGASNRAIKPAELRRLLMDREATGYESLVPDGAAANDLDRAKVEQYRSELAGNSELDAEELLLQRGCLHCAGDEPRPSHAGLLLFGRQPRRWVRSAGILAARYSGITMDDNFLKEEIGGTLPEQIHRAEAFVVNNMRRGVRLSGLDRIEEGEYPLEVVREAIVNAVAHRDYQIRGEEIRILLFADRIEVYSPGRLPGHVTLDNLIEERFSRNEIVVQVLSDLGFIERLGYGIDRMIRAMASVGLPAPRFEEKPAGFQVTLYGQGAALLDSLPDRRRWLQQGLSQRQEKAMALVLEEGRITNRDYQSLCPGTSAETLRRDLVDLTRKDLLLKIGDKRGTYYIPK